jgi:hypothetical protein
MKHKIITFLSLLFLLSGCAKLPDKTYNVSVTVEARNDAQSFCTDLMQRPVTACAIWNVSYIGQPVGLPMNRCKIIISPDAVETDLNLLGHEFKHCLVGGYH